VELKKATHILYPTVKPTVTFGMEESNSEGGDKKFRRVPKDSREVLRHVSLKPASTFFGLFVVFDYQAVKSVDKKRLERGLPCRHLLAHSSRASLTTCSGPSRRGTSFGGIAFDFGLVS